MTRKGLPQITGERIILLLIYDLREQYCTQYVDTSSYM